MDESVKVIIIGDGNGMPNYRGWSGSIEFPRSNFSFSSSMDIV